MRNSIAVGIAAFAAALAWPALALASTSSSTPRAHDRGAKDDNAVHAAALDPSDQELANEAADALAKDKKAGVPATVWAYNGVVTIDMSTTHEDKALAAHKAAVDAVGPQHVAPLGPA